MATYNYLDKTGLGQVWGKIKTYIGNNFLSKTNTTSYTPTADYHPATKKYVDDVTSGSSGTPEIYVGSGTPSGYTLYIDPDGTIQSGEGVEF